MNYTKAFENVKYFGMLLVNYRKTAINTYPVARKRKQPEPNKSVPAVGFADALRVTYRGELCVLQAGLERFVHPNVRAFFIPKFCPGC